MKKAQSSIEYIMIISFGLLIMLPITYYAYSYASGQTDETVHSTLKGIGDQIADTAEQVYYLGAPSKMTIEANFPDTVKDITILGQKELVFHFGDKRNEIVFISKPPIVGPYLVTNGAGNECPLSGINAAACWSKGNKQVTLEANSDNTVSIILS
jgi:hypothetical protein